jgi:YD repeat-containing protein
MEFSYGSSGKLEKIKDSSGRETAISMDEAGNLLEVVYPDDEKRQFTYDERGLLTVDKKGNAEKKYTWDDDYAVLTEVELPNGGKRTLDPWVLKYALNGRQSTPGQPIAFPAGGSAMESTVTFEDGRVEKSVTGSGWDSKYLNGKFIEKTTYGDLVNNRVPVAVERGEGGFETAEILYNSDLQFIARHNYSPLARRL